MSMLDDAHDDEVSMLALFPCLSHKTGGLFPPGHFGTRFRARELHGCI